MKILIAIALGSCIGGLSRYALTIFIQNKFLSSFPYGTLCVNIIGCFLIGIVFGLSERGNVSVLWRLFFITGCLGGFTTFSSFSIESIIMLRNGFLFQAFIYIIISVGAGLLATLAGLSLIKLI